jgi:hypothetical protein
VHVPHEQSKGDGRVERLDVVVCLRCFGRVEPLQKYTGCSENQKVKEREPQHKLTEATVQHLHMRA